MPRPAKSPASIASKYVSFRLTEAEYAVLEATACRAGLGVNELVRRLARRSGGRVIIHTTKRYDPAFIAQVRAIGTNLNQLTHNAHIYGRISPKIGEICDEIRRIVFAAAEESERP